MTFVTVNTAGDLPPIPDAYTSPELAVTLLTDPVRVTAYKRQVAAQMNAQSSGPTFEDLSERIADVRLETTAQGASILELDLIDPYNLILQSGFVQTDEGGYLYPPIDVNFPQGDSDAVWRLCALRPSSFSGNGANVTWTFEDRIVSILRTMSGPEISNPNESLGGFIMRLVQQANQRASGLSVQVLQIPETTDSSGRTIISTKTTANNATLGPVNVNVPAFKPIRLVELLSPDDPNYRAPLSKPASFNLRDNPNKDPGTLVGQMQIKFTQYQQTINDLFGNFTGKVAGAIGSAPLNLGEIERSLANVNPFPDASFWAGRPFFTGTQA